ncbi:MAG: hypothetical protein QOI57_2745 [Rubrobacteraceae bacterium]|nr:hypothetical protein [Rubrobacteraceae bacterium]
MEIYSQVVTTNSFTAEAVLLGFLVLLVGLVHQSETFERLVGSKVRGPLYLAHGAYGLPLILLLMEIQRRSPRRSGGGLRILGILVLVVIVVIIGVLALIAFLIYRYLRRRR